MEKLRVIQEKLRLDGIFEFLKMVIGFLYYYYRKLILKREIVLKNIHGYKMFLNIQVEGVSRTLDIHKIHERLETELIKEVLLPGMVILDVGANIGYYALLEAFLIGTGGLVYALEPFPRNYNLLLKNIHLNDYQDRIKLFRIAAGDETGTAKLYLGPSDNNHCLVKNDHLINIFQEVRGAYSDSVEVETVILDDFLKGREKIDFIRMDLEGFECQVIDGLKETLTRDRPDLFFEIHPIGDIDPDPRYTPYIEYLLGLGYKAKSLICPARKNTLSRFSELGYEPKKISFSGLVHSIRYDNINSGDLIKVAARRPKITRALYLTCR